MNFTTSYPDTVNRNMQNSYTTYVISVHNYQITV